MTDEGGKHFRVKRISGTSKSAATGPSIIDAATEKRYVRCQSAACAWSLGETGNKSSLTSRPRVCGKPCRRLANRIPVVVLDARDACEQDPLTGRGWSGMDTSSGYCCRFMRMNRGVMPVLNTRLCRQTRKLKRQTPRSTHLAARSAGDATSSFIALSVSWALRWKTHLGCGGQTSEFKTTSRHSQTPRRRPRPGAVLFALPRSDRLIDGEAAAYPIASNWAQTMTA